MSDDDIPVDREKLRKFILQAMWKEDQDPESPFNLYIDEEDKNSITYAGTYGYLSFKYTISKI